MNEIIYKGHEIIQAKKSNNKHYFKIAGYYGEFTSVEAAKKAIEYKVKRDNE